MNGHNQDNDCPTCNNRSGYLSQHVTRGYLEQVEYDKRLRESQEKGNSDD